MSLQSECEVLQNIPMFGDVDITKLRLLALSGQRISYQANEEIFHQGDAATAVYVLLDGVAEVLREEEEESVSLAKLEGDAIFGETGVLCDTPRGATIRAITPVTVLEIDRNTFTEVVRDVPQFALAIARELARRLEIMNEKFASTSKD